MDQLISERQCQQLMDLASVSVWEGGREGGREGPRFCECVGGREGGREGGTSPL